MTPAELLEQFCDGPVTAEAIKTATLALKKALIERALAGEFNHHIGYSPGAAKPTAVTNQRNDKGTKTVLTKATAWQATTLQTSCIVHLILNSLDYAVWKDRKLLAAAIRPIYTAPSAESALAELDAFTKGPWGRSLRRSPPPGVTPGTV